MAFTATQDVMLPATVTGSWPRPHWYTQNMWGRPLDTAMMDPWFREQFSDAHAVVISDQQRAGLDILTTGDYHLDEDVAGRSWHHYLGVGAGSMSAATFQLIPSRAAKPCSGRAPMSATTTS